MAIRNKPNRTFGYDISPMYTIALPHMSNFCVYSDVGQKISWQRQMRYRCSDEAELPSESDFMRQVFDTDNSYNFHQLDNFVGGGLRYIHNGESVSVGKNDSYRIEAYLEMPIDYHHYRLNYTRGSGEAYSGITHRNAVLLSP